MEDKHTVTSIVKEKDTAFSHGSGSLKVLATPAMIALMEKAAHILAAKYAGKDKDTVGIHIEVTHKRPSPVGMNIEATASLVKQEGKKLYFLISARDNNGEIGSGTHIRYTIDPVKFLEIIS